MHGLGTKYSDLSLWHLSAASEMLYLSPTEREMLSFGTVYSTTLLLLADPLEALLETAETPSSQYFSPF